MRQSIQAFLVVTGCSLFQKDVILLNTGDEQIVGQVGDFSAKELKVMSKFYIVSPPYIFNHEETVKYWRVKAENLQIKNEELIKQLKH